MAGVWMFVTTTFGALGPDGPKLANVFPFARLFTPWTLLGSIS